MPGRLDEAPSEVPVYTFGPLKVHLDLFTFERKQAYVRIQAIRPDGMAFYYYGFDNPIKMWPRQMWMVSFRVLVIA
jgi:hypothetical protein